MRGTRKIAGYNFAATPKLRLTAERAKRRLISRYIAASENSAGSVSHIPHEADIHITNGFRNHRIAATCASDFLPVYSPTIL